MSTDHICTEKEHISDIKAMLIEMREEQRAMHKAMFVSNGQRAIVEIVRENAAWREKMDAMFKKAVAGIVAMILAGHGVDKLADFLLK